MCAAFDVDLMTRQTSPTAWNSSWAVDDEHGLDCSLDMIQKLLEILNGETGS
jgi:hypothetical protein